MVTPAARREAVAHLRESLEVSERRACTMITADRSVVRYRSRRPDDAELRGRLRELADQRRRFGYRRLTPTRFPELKYPRRRLPRLRPGASLWDRALLGRSGLPEPPEASRPCG